MTGNGGERGLTLPLGLGLLALLLFLLLQTAQLVRERGALQGALAGQDAAVADGDRVRGQLNTLLSGAAGLANGGNEAAKAGLAALARQGISYTPPPPAP